MRKFLTTALAVALTWAAASAVPAKPGLKKTVTQSDGTIVTVSMVGDEWHHSWVTSDGLPCVQNAAGDMVYRTANGASTVIAHETNARTLSEQSFLNINASQMTVESITARIPRYQARAENTARNMRDRMRGSMSEGPRKAAGNPQVPQTGTPKIPVLLVQYSDVSFKNNKSAFVTQYTSTTSKSAYKYFYDQSNGQYGPQYEVYGPYTLSGTRATYGGNDSNGDDVGVAKMVGEAIDKAGNDINWANYDNDGDGEADVCIVVYAGGGEAQTSIDEQIWPCQWDLTSGKSYNDGTGARNRNGVKIDKFAVFNELNGTSSTKLDGVGTFCHEFGHCMGLPDFYETTYKNGYYGMGYWDIMCSGSYNNDGYCPVGYNAYEKEYMGWYTPVTPVENTQYTLPVWNKGDDVAIKVTSPLNSNECYYLENRSQQGWDAYIADEGMLVTHLTYVASRWTANTPNNQAVQLFTVIPADNTLTENSENKDCFGESNHELTDTSTPAAGLNMKAAGTLASTTGSAGKMGQPLTDIYLNSNGTVTFWYMRGTSTPLDAPTLNDATIVTTTTFTASWTAVANAASYELQIDPVGGSSSAGSVYSRVTSASSLSAGDKIIIVDESAGVAAGELSNSVLQPTDVTISNGQVDLTGVSGVNVFTLAGSSDNWLFQLSDGSYLTQTTVKKLTTGTTGTTASISISGGSATITMGGNVLCYNSSSPRFTTYNASSAQIRLPQIYKQSGSSAAPRRAVAASRTISGITTTSYTVEDLADDTDYSFKVRAIPATTDTEHTTGPWSNVKTTHTVAADPEPLILADETKDFVAYVGDDDTQLIEILYEDLSDPISATLTGSEMFSLDRTTITIDQSGDGSATLAVIYHPTAAGDHTATVTLSSTGADPVTVTLNGTAEYPVFVPEMSDAQAVTSSSFTASWSDATDASMVASYTLHVNKVTTGGGGGDEPTPSGGTEYVKVTSTDDLTSGQYLIVYEGGNLAFNGGLETLDATSNTISVTISNNKIAATETTNAAAFTFDASAGTLKSASGKYIGNAGDSNGLAANTTVLTNTVSISDGSASIKSSGGAYLRYNATSGQERFRYFKSSTYSSQKAIQLYKLSGGNSAPRRVTTSGSIDSENGLDIMGITDKEYTLTGLEAGATYQFKVKAVYTGNTESEWSNTKSVQLLESSDPKLTVNKTELSFSGVVIGQTATETFTITGTNLTDVVNVNVSGDNVFAVSPATIAATEADGATVTVTYAPTAFVTSNAIITVSSTGAPDVTVSVSGSSALEKHAPVMAAAANVMTNSFKAVWTDATPVENIESYTLYVNKKPEVTGYELVTDASVLKAGDKLIITNGTSDAVKAASTSVSSSKISPKDVTVTDGFIDESTLSADVEVFTLGGSAGSWNFKANSSTNSGKYLCTSSSQTLGYGTSSTSDYALASIAVASSSNIATITFKDGKYQTVEYYNDLFTVYKETSANVYLFRQAGSETPGSGGDDPTPGGDDPTPTVTTVNDVLNNGNTINSTSQNYSNWTASGSTLAAAYSGNSGGSNTTIQLRSDKNNSGIVSTTSGGKIKKVTVDWYSGTSDGRTLNVYGSNSAYTAASNLYASATQGTLLGTIVKGTSTELTISGEYAYIGVRSNSGAMYLDNITFTWETASSNSAPRRVTPQGSADEGGLKVSGISPEDKEYTVTGLTPGATYDFYVEAVYKDETTGTKSNVESITLPEGPTILVNPATLAFGEVFTNSTNTLTFTVSGTSLTGNVAVDIEGDNVLSVSPTSFTPDASGNVSGEVTVTYAPTALGNHSATVTLSSSGATSKTVTASGSAVLQKVAPVMAEADYAFVTGNSFKAVWTDATPAANVRDYTLYVNKKAKQSIVTLLIETFRGVTATSDSSTDISESLNNVADNTGWTGSKVYETAGGLKLGSSKGAGYISSPYLDLSATGGKVTVKFSAKRYGTDSDVISLYAGNDDASNNSVTQSVTDPAADYVVVLDCNAEANQYVTIESTKRCYIYSVTIYAGDVSAQLAAAGAPRRATPEGDADNGGLTVTGITEKSYTVTGLTPGATYEYYVKANYSDGTVSDASNHEEVTLPDGTTLADVLESESGSYTVSDDMVIVAAIPASHMYYATNGTDWLPIESETTLTVGQKIHNVGGTFNGSRIAPLFTMTTSDASDATIKYNIVTYFMGNDFDNVPQVWEDMPAAGQVIEVVGYYYVEGGVPTLRGYGKNSSTKGRSLRLLTDYSGSLDYEAGSYVRLKIAVQLAEAWSGARRRISAADDDAYTNLMGQVIEVSDVYTGINDLDAGREPVKRHYVNAAGAVSDQPYDGFNIVVTTWSDGTTTAVKVAH